MNIFALSKCPIKSAHQMIDKHIVKMPTETCQMLHTNSLFFDYVEHYNEEPTLKQLKEFHKDINSNLMKPAMLNHPSTIWARQSMHNAKWLYEHGLALCEEYTYRYGKIHGSESRIKDVEDYYIQAGDSSKATPVTVAMDDKYRLEYGVWGEDWDFVISSYRHYYLEGKWRFAEWRMNRQPSWWGKDHIQKKYQEWNDWLESENERIRRANNV